MKVYVTVLGYVSAVYQKERDAVEGLINDAITADKYNDHEARRATIMAVYDKSGDVEAIVKLLVRERLYRTRVDLRIEGEFEEAHNCWIDCHELPLAGLSGRRYDSVTDLMVGEGVSQEVQDRVS